MSFLRYSICTTGVLVVALVAGCSSTPRSGYYSQNMGKKHTFDSRPHKDVWQRIRLGYGMPELKDERVSYWVNYYSSRSSSVQAMARRSSKYIYYITTELEKRGMPTELALLPFVESAYNARAVSRSKAAGLWQFIPSTGTHYNLPQNWWRDERRDPVNSTQAALNYLSYLYSYQGNDWHLALASYNWGEGAVMRARERNQSKGLGTDYLSLTMPEETRNYVPKLMALKKIIANPSKYGVSLPSIPDKPYFVEVAKNVDIDMDVAARLAGMSVREFKELNPASNRPVILSEHKQRILIPKANVAKYEKNLQSYKGKLSSWQGYTPTVGESLASIANRFGISLERLKSLNGYQRKQNVAIASRTLLIPSSNLGLDVNASSSGLNASPRAVVDVQSRLASNTKSVPAMNSRFASNTQARELPSTRVKPQLASYASSPNIKSASMTPASQAPVLASVGRTIPPRSYENVTPTQDPLANLVASNQVRDAFGDNSNSRPVAPNQSTQALQAARTPADNDALVMMNEPRAVASYANRNMPKAYAAGYQAADTKVSARSASYQSNAKAQGTSVARNPTTHNVMAGETLYSLARRYKTTVADLTALNNIGESGLQAGMVLRLPGVGLKG